MYLMKRLFVPVSVLTLTLVLVSLWTQTQVEAVPPPPLSNVNVVNSVLPVRDVDNPAQQPWVMNAAIDMVNGQSSLVSDFGPAVPDGKRFVVEYASARTQLPAGVKARYTVFAGGQQYHFGPDVIGTDFTVDHLVLNETVRMYTEFPQQVRLNFTRFPGNSGTAFTRMNLTGYLVDLIP